MFNNNYEGVLDLWKIRLIRQRARRQGFRGPELDDAQQVVVLSLLDFTFDQTRSNGACEATVVTAVVDRQLAMIRRGETRARRRVDELKESFQEYCDDVGPALSIDVERVVESLSATDQRICRGLSVGQSISQLAQQLGMNWHTVKARIDAIRRRFERQGLTASHASESEAALV